MKSIFLDTKVSCCLATDSVLHGATEPFPKPMCNPWAKVCPLALVGLLLSFALPQLIKAQELYSTVWGTIEEVKSSQIPSLATVEVRGRDDAYPRTIQIDHDGSFTGTFDYYFQDTLCLSISPDLHYPVHLHFSPAFWSGHLRDGKMQLTQIPICLAQTKGRKHDHATTSAPRSGSKAPLLRAPRQLYFWVWEQKYTLHRVADAQHHFRYEIRL